MKISLNWLNEYVDVDLSAEQVAEILSNLGFPNEGISVVDGAIHDHGERPEAPLVAEFAEDGEAIHAGFHGRAVCTGSIRRCPDRA